MDLNFSKELEKIRQEQLEASRQRLLESNASRLQESTIDENRTQLNDENSKIETVTRKLPFDCDNSMLFVSNRSTKNDSFDDDDSFLAMERQCNQEEKRQQMINANDTMLFDVEPPPELFNHSINLTVDKTATPTLEVLREEYDEEDDESVEISPVKYMHLIRPSTIIEETSSQFENSSKNENSSMKTSTSMDTTDNSANNSSKYLSVDEGNTSGNTNANDKEPPKQNKSVAEAKKMEREKRRETFAFKRRNFQFFPDENLNPINESIQSNDGNASKVSDVDEESFVDCEASNTFASPEEKREFNDTLEAMDFFLEKGKRLIEQTPISQRDSHQRSIMETPLFSCKRSRILSEMAVEMMPLPKRGPLLDFSTPENVDTTRRHFFKDDDKK